eukprot:13104348-Heterocapsa_arctica.AAC.1
MRRVRAWRSSSAEGDPAVDQEAPGVRCSGEQRLRRLREHQAGEGSQGRYALSLIHISEPTRR